jgi:hypothetical protein
MSDLIHLPANCHVDDIIENVEKDGVVIVDNFIEEAWLKKF